MQRLYAALFLSMLSGSLRLPMSQGSMGVSGNISPSESGQAKDTVTGLCLPWPECATAWVDKAVRERETVGGSLAQLMQAIDKGKSQNCSQTSMCKPEKRIEEIDKILAGVQKLWEEQAIKALAARSKVEDALWKRWIEEATDRVDKLKALAREHHEKQAVLSDIWLRRMSALSLEASLLPTDTCSASPPLLSPTPVTDDAFNRTRAAHSGGGSWERGGETRNAAVAQSWRKGVWQWGNVSRAGAVTDVHRAARCLLRDLLDAAIEDGDLVETACPANGKSDCFQRCRRYCRVHAECRIFAVVGSSCVVSASLAHRPQTSPLLLRLPSVQIGFITAAETSAGGSGGAQGGPTIASSDAKLATLFKRLKRQAPHSQEHKLCAIVPFRDGCAAMSQGKGRRENLREFVRHMPVFLDLVGVSHFRVVVVEQTQRGHWNKGILFNRGVKYAETIGCDYLVMNDVDQLPVSDQITHAWPAEPTHLCTNTDQKDFTFYDAMVGGAIILQVAHYKRLNGYSNRYFGWGQEDDDMYERINFEFKSVKHIDQKLGQYHALSHGRVKDLDVTDLFRNNTAYLELLRKKGREVFSKDGYGNVAEVSTLVKTWTGPNPQAPGDMAVVSDGDYDHLLVDALDPRTKQPLPPCGDSFDLHASIAKP